MAPAKHLHRFYWLSVEPTLFGDFALVREWGRIGAKRGRITEEWLPSEEDANCALARALKARVKRGYIYSLELLEHSFALPTCRESELSIATWETSKPGSRRSLGKSTHLSSRHNELQERH